MKPAKEDEDINSIGGVALLDHHVVATVPRIIFPSWGLERQEMLVQPEYNKADQAALLARKTARRVLVVTGQPGIGLPSSLSNAQRI